MKRFPPLHIYSFIFLVLVVSFANCIEDTGPYNTHYTIPFYYGSRFENRNSKKVILSDIPTQFMWSHTFNQDYHRNLWIADKTQSTVLMLSKERPTWNAMFKITGKENVLGLRNGNIDKATFNMTTSVCVYDQNRTQILLARSIKPVYLYANMTSYIPCMYINMDNYTMCGQLIEDPAIDQIEAQNAQVREQLNDQEQQQAMNQANSSNGNSSSSNIGGVSGGNSSSDNPGLDNSTSSSSSSNNNNSSSNGPIQFLQNATQAYDDGIFDGEKIDFRRVKYIPFAELPSNEQNYQYPTGVEPRIAYVADKGNNCVRRIDVSKRNVDTYAGTCGTAGFKDGPQGQNFLNSPELVGVDAEGWVFIYDQGNYGYIRMVEPYPPYLMHTLIQGACMEDQTVIPPKIPFQLKLRPMLCYRNWIKTKGLPDEHIVTLKKAVIQAAEQSRLLFEEQFTTVSDTGRGIVDLTTDTTLNSVPLLDDCVADHFVNCPATQPRPLVMNKDFLILNVTGVEFPDPSTMHGQGGSDI